MKVDLNKEKEIFESIKTDKQKYGELYTYFVNDVYRFTYSLTMNRQNAEDITSQVFLKFYEKIENYEWKDISMKVWLFRSSRNIVYSSLYRKKSMDQLEESNVFSDENLEKSVTDKDLINKIKEKIDSLKLPEKEVVLLRIWEELPFSDIAKVQEDKESTVRKRFQRAMDKIRVQMREEGHMKLYAMPILTTNIMKLGESSLYSASQNLINKSLFMKGNIMSESINNTANMAQGAGNVSANTATQTGIMSSVGNVLFGSTVAKSLTITGAVMLTTGAGVVGYNVIDNSSDNNEDQIALVEEVSEDNKDDEDVVLEVTPTPEDKEDQGRNTTASNPNNEPIKLVDYKDDILGVKFSYPSDYEIDIVEDIGASVPIYDLIIKDENGNKQLSMDLGMYFDGPIAGNLNDVDSYEIIEPTSIGESVVKIGIKLQFDEEYSYSYASYVSQESMGDWELRDEYTNGGYMLNFPVENDYNGHFGQFRQIRVRGYGETVNEKLINDNIALSLIEL